MNQFVHVILSVSFSLVKPTELFYSMGNTADPYGKIETSLLEMRCKEKTDGRNDGRLDAEIEMIM